MKKLKFLRRIFFVYINRGSLFMFELQGCQMIVSKKFIAGMQICMNLTLSTPSTFNNCTNHIPHNLKWALNTEIFNFLKGGSNAVNFVEKNTLTWYAWVREHIILPATKLNQIAERVCMQTLIRYQAISSEYTSLAGYHAMIQFK